MTAHLVALRAGAAVIEYERVVRGYRVECGVPGCGTEVGLSPTSSERSAVEMCEHHCRQSEHVTALATLRRRGRVDTLDEDG